MFVNVRRQRSSSACCHEEEQEAVLEFSHLWHLLEGDEAYKAVAKQYDKPDKNELRNVFEHDQDRADHRPNQGGQ